VSAADEHTSPLVLVAEDDRATRESLALALELEGYRVQAVADGAEALSAVTSEPPAALVIDVMMPGLDGLSVCRRLRARGDRTPVLILTARTEVSVRVSAGDDDWIAACACKFHASALNGRFEQMPAQPWPPSR
jgi:two-component system response regulator MprA